MTDINYALDGVDSELIRAAELQGCAADRVVTLGVPKIVYVDIRTN